LKSPIKHKVVGQNQYSFCLWQVQDVETIDASCQYKLSLFYIRISPNTKKRVYQMLADLFLQIYMYINVYHYDNGDVRLDLS